MLKRIGELAGIISAIIILMLGIILDLPEFTLTFPFVIFLGFIFLQIAITQVKFNRLRNTHPNVIPDDKIFLERPFNLFIRGGNPTEDVLERYYLVLRNIKHRGINLVDTSSVHAIISFYDKDCKELEGLSHENPFWFDANPPWKRPTDFRIIIKASSEPQRLCLVARKQGSDELYVFSDNSYVPNVRSLEPFQETLILPHDSCYISVQLSAGNMDVAPIWISLKNQGADQKPLFELIDNPCEENRDVS